MKVFLYTLFALMAFAFNSILCRVALGSDQIDATSFTAVRLIAGAIALVLIASATGNLRNAITGGGWMSAFFLFAYAICFSFAYLGLTTGTGALILFGSVQVSMIAAAMANGERPGMLEMAGVAVAFGGLIYLVLPGLSSPPLMSSLLMAAAGASWGMYTLRGRSSANPIADTAGNFIRAVPMMAVMAVPFIGGFYLSERGIVLAVLSGAVTSGTGYSVWYAVLKHHTATRAAVLQLAVPVIAAAGGVVFMSETASMRLLTASVLILGGIVIAIFAKRVTFTKT